MALLRALACLMAAAYRGDFILCRERASAAVRGGPSGDSGARTAAAQRGYIEVLHFVRDERRDERDTAALPEEYALTSAQRCFTVAGVERLWRLDFSAFSGVPGHGARGLMPLGINL